MLRAIASVAALAVLGAGLLTAAPQEKKDTKKDAKKAPANEITGKVVKVDVEKKTITVQTDAGRKDITINDDTKFIGPRGGVSDERLKDDRLEPGYEIRIVTGAGGKTVTEVHLPYRKREEEDKKDADKKTTDKKAADKKTTDKKETDKKTTDKKETDKKSSDKKSTDKKSSDK